jgi:hypothetical protein
MNEEHRPTRRVRVEQGVYLQANGKYTVCFMAGGRPRFCTAGYDIEEARTERTIFIESTRACEPGAPVRPRRRGWWIERRVEAG